MASRGAPLFGILRMINCGSRSSAEDFALRNKIFSELEEDDKHSFLDYGLDVDLFVSATTAEVVEVFRRMNSYTVPLNAEEQRHATYQGKFKWFIVDVADKVEAIFLQTGIFKEKQLVRMADNKLLTELCDSFLNGIRTTDKKILDSVYRDCDEEFRESTSYYAIDFWMPSTKFVELKRYMTQS